MTNPCLGTHVHIPTMGIACAFLANCALGPPSADVLFGGVARPAQAVAPAGRASGRDGIYAGSAVEMNGDVYCPSPLRISNFQVEENTVHFGGFSGPIAADGTVMTPFGSELLTGRFEGPAFNGRSVMSAP